MKLTFATRQFQGNRRRQEDDYHVDPDRGLVILCDGIGGHNGGAEAAQTAVEHVKDALLADAVQEEAFRDAHVAVKQLGIFRAGCTALTAQFKDDRLVLAWSGDTRAYRWRFPLVQQLTQDHHGICGCLDRCFGSGGYFEPPDVARLVVKGGDTYLFATDGLYEDGDKWILDRLCGCEAEEMATRLERKTQDNCTYVVVRAE